MAKIDYNMQAEQNHHHQSPDKSIMYSLRGLHDKL